MGRNRKQWKKLGRNEDSGEESEEGEKSGKERKGVGQRRRVERIGKE